MTAYEEPGAGVLVVPDCVHGGLLMADHVHSGADHQGNLQLELPDLG